ncbi:MAG TPA: D-2-hydroxyacid dehydrogenase [Verrucomicrobiae bacterium]|nr:D-2-hydroxyacid dehydrogenase [Verrucomicrobiae bacterium]
MKIVVLDGFTLNPGDLTWDDLRLLGKCEIHDRTPAAEVVPRSQDADCLLTNKTPLGRVQFEQLPKLKYVGVLATGTNVVDLPAARERGVTVTNVPAYGTRSVAQATFALLLELTQHVGEHSRGAREGRWSRSLDWCYWEQPLVELDGLLMGIIGFGRIGRAVSELARAFGMKVLVLHRASVANSTGFQTVSLETLFRESDVISLHCPLTPETAKLVNAERLSWMKPSAFLLNTSRGPLVDEEALANALNAGQIAGAGLDVLSQEPPLPDNPLLRARHCIVTPHHAWATQAARSRLLKTAVANVRAFLSGSPQNVVS